MKKLSILAMAILGLAACEKETKVVTVPSKYGNGVFISNEGIYQTGTGTVSHYKVGEEIARNEVFLEENGFPVGNTLQSITIEGDNAYMVVNYSATVEVANAKSMKSQIAISGFNSPRYLTVVNSSTAYVTDWFANNVKIVDLNSGVILDSIATGTGPENMAITSDGNVYVTNTGGWDTDSTVTVINSNSHAVVTTIATGYLPQSVQIDKNGKVWVLCSGKNDFMNPANSTEGQLLRIDPVTNMIEQTFVFPTNTEHPAHLKINGEGDELYYESDVFSGKLYKMNITAGALPTMSFVDKTFYSIGVDPKTGDVYGSSIVTFNQAAWVYRYDMNGSILDSFKAGINPGNFTFKNN